MHVSKQILHFAAKTLSGVWLMESDMQILLPTWVLESSIYENNRKCENNFLRDIPNILEKVL